MARKYVFTLIVDDDYLENNQTVEQDKEDFKNKKLFGSDLLGVAETDSDCKITMDVEDLK